MSKSITKISEFRPFKAVVLDMDGVLVDSERYWLRVQSEFLEGLVPTWNASFQKAIHGMSAHAVYDYLVAMHGLRASREEFFAHYQDLAREIYGKHSAMLPGALDFLRKVAKLKPVALASSAPQAWMDIVIARFQLGPYLTAVVSADDVGGRIKPAPDVYQKAAEKLFLSASDCLAIEDTAKGISSAQAAGMFCLAFRNGFNEQQDFSAANYEARGFSDELLQELLSSLRAVHDPYVESK